MSDYAQVMEENKALKARIADLEEAGGGTEAMKEALAKVARARSIDKAKEVAGAALEAQDAE